MLTLRVVAVLYLMSALWCVFALELAANALGFNVSTDAARAEFFAVYGGLQIGLAIVMGVGSFVSRYYLGCLFAATVVSISLFVARCLGLIFYPEALESNTIIVMAVLELGIAVALLRALKRAQVIGVSERI
jgi:hypothetical protein